MLSQIIVVDVDPAAMSEFLSSWKERVSPGIKTEAAISETDPPAEAKAFGADFSQAMAAACARDGTVAEAKTDHVLIKSAEGYYRERGDGATPGVSEAHRFERREAQRIVNEDRSWTPDVRIEEIPAEPKAAEPKAAEPKAAEPVRAPLDRVFIKNDRGYWRADGCGLTQDVTEAYPYPRGDAERRIAHFTSDPYSKDGVRIVEIAPAVTDPWQDRYNRVCERNLLLHVRVAELLRENAELSADNTAKLIAAIKSLAA